MFEKQQRILGTSSKSYHYSIARKLYVDTDTFTEVSIKIRDSLERIELNVKLSRVSSF